MNIIDNGDGTYSDSDTGDLYDGNGSIINAVPDAGIFNFDNVAGYDSAGNVDTTYAAGTPVLSNVNTPNGLGDDSSSVGQKFLDGADALIHTIESGFTNLYTPLAQAGVIQTPAQRAANQQALATTQAAVVMQQSQDKTKTYLIVGGVILLGLLLWKKAA